MLFLVGGYQAVHLLRQAAESRPVQMQEGQFQTCSAECHSFSAQVRHYSLAGTSESNDPIGSHGVAASVAHIIRIPTHGGLRDTMTTGGSAFLAVDRQRTQGACPWGQ